ncbi:MAG: tol-pal system protein YbgF [Gammaproteobacteria bacterium]|nr:tol-pal system protein YbgF [Gammaproteobacteria bacterium]
MSIAIRLLALTGALLLPLLAAAADDARPPTQEERIAHLERLAASQGLAEVIVRMDELQQELQRLRGKLEVQTHELQQLKESQRSANQDFDQRLRGLAASPAVNTTADVALDASALPADASAGLPEATTTGPATADTAVADPAQESATYQQAFTLLKEARYEKAITAFQAYLAHYPAGANADNAQYWLGEAHYVTRQFKEALQAFQTLVDKSPASPKRPDAMLKAGFVHYEMGKWDAARKSLNDVIQTYPNTSVAQLADNRLQRMKKEGH